MGAVGILSTKKSHQTIARTAVWAIMECSQTHSGAVGFLKDFLASTAWRGYVKSHPY